MSSAPQPTPTATLPLADRKALEAAGLHAGDVLDGKYQIERVLGAGGMGLVLGAVHLALRQPVALKLLLPSSLADATVVARFEREARAAAMLRSEHVARVLDVGHIPNGSPYMVMELLEGQDLDQVIEDAGPLASDVAANYILQACEAIAEAHSLGIIHRDLKPHNLFLSRNASGEPLVKVLDFGISKLPDEREDLSLTKTRDVMGSPLYMAPEQLRSAREVDVRADIWALGAILYRLVTGRTPFDGETMAQLCARVLVDPPAPVRRIKPDVPESLALVIERCLEKEPSARYADVAALATALDPFATGQVLRPADRVIAISTRPPPSSSAPSPPSIPAPPVSMPPQAGTVRISQHPGAFTGKSLPAITQSELHSTPPRKRSASVVPFVALLAIGLGGGGAYVLRGRLQAKPVPAVPVPTNDAPSASVSPPAPASVSVAPAVVVSAPVSASAEPSASHSGKPPIVKRPPPIIKRPPAPGPAAPAAAPAPAPAPAPANDDAPDLRK